MEFLWRLLMMIGILAGTGVSQGCAPPRWAQNLALWRPATQSSTFENAVAGRAVDGKRDGKWEQGSCAHTQLDTEPWWNVDLGSRQSVSTVIVKNREDECCGERIRGAQIHVGDSLIDHGKNNPICGTITDTRPGSISTICCNGLVGRYVTIIIPGRAEYLTLCEVEVIAQGCALSPGARNLALGRPAIQSSIYDAYGPEKSRARNAVDGKCDGIWEHGSCSHTQYETEPWWNVDLGSRQSVSAVIVKNREDCCGERLEGAQIHVGHSLEDHGKQNPICGTITDTRLGSTSTICCNGLEGRYVTIVIPGRAGYLTLCEVEVLDQGCAPPPGAENLALGRPAIQSSTYENYGLGKAMAGNAVDGKRDGIWEQGSCSHTQYDTEPWWKVDLGSQHSISAVIVKNREDCCGERLTGAQIRVGDSLEDHGKQNPICGTITDTRPGSISTICCNGLVGRYVTIIIPGRAEYLTLCEVEVIAQGCALSPGAQNLALRRPATQSSTFDQHGAEKARAGNAVDGKCDGIWEQGSCSHTQHDTEPWWNVDLGSRHSVSAVIVKNREDCCGERLRGAQIRVGDALVDHGKHDPICGTIKDTSLGSVSTICCNGLVGRYVTIVIPDRAEFLTLCEVEVIAQGCAPPPGARNLALGRPAIQSSIYDAYGPEKSRARNAVDGKCDGIWEHGSCSHTQYETEPWWNVDLGSRQSVSAVIVKNREDCCGERLEGAQIHVGHSLEDHGKQNPICGTITDTRLGSTSTICCNGLEGRYVTIVIPGRAGYLTLCEVEVLDQGCAPPPGAENLALGRPAIQSSTYENYGLGKAMAGNAVDGKRDGIWEQGSCSHTQYDTEPWWKVDLGSQHSISAVIVKNREDCCGERLTGAQIRVGDSLEDHGKQNPICGTITDTTPGSLSPFCCGGMKGRYVTITIPVRAEYLTLCEVEVYGTPLEDK
ncbi:uncharacterized protein RBU57_001934 isoform 3-T3 [Macrochelys suwanniensis]